MTIHTYSVAKVDYRGAAAPEEYVPLALILCFFLTPYIHNQKGQCPESCTPDKDGHYEGNIDQTKRKDSQTAAKDKYK